MMQVEVREFSVLAQNFSLSLLLLLSFSCASIYPLSVPRSESAAGERERRRGRAFDEIYMNNVVRCVLRVTTRTLFIRGEGARHLSLIGIFI